MDTIYRVHIRKNPLFMTYSLNFIPYRKYLEFLSKVMFLQSWIWIDRISYYGLLWNRHPPHLPSLLLVHLLQDWIGVIIIYISKDSDTCMKTKRSLTNGKGYCSHRSSSQRWTNGQRPLKPEVYVDSCGTRSKHQSCTNTHAWALTKKHLVKYMRHTS